MLYKIAEIIIVLIVIGGLADIKTDAKKLSDELGILNKWRWNSG